MQKNCRDREGTLIKIEDTVSCHYENVTGEVIAKLAGEVILVDPKEGIPFEISSREVFVESSPIENFKEVTTSKIVQDLFKAREEDHKKKKVVKKKVKKKVTIGESVNW